VLSAVGRVLDQLVRDGRLDRDQREALRDVPAIRGTSPRLGRRLKWSEIRAPFQSCPDTRSGRRDEALLALLIGCGLRAGEVVGLELRDVRQAELVVRDSKGGKSRHLPVPPDVALVLGLWLEARGDKGSFFLVPVGKGGPGHLPEDLHGRWTSFRGQVTRHRVMIPASKAGVFRANASRAEWQRNGRLVSARSKLGFNATWSMAVGGMVGGGIFSTLGVVIRIAGAWAWLSFLAAGLVALAAGYSYVALAAQYKEGGGAFTFLREIDADGFAGSLSWVLIVGYVLTNSVYAATFGHYLGNVVGLGPGFTRAAAIGILVLFIGLNLRGVGEAGGVEIFLVWFKLAVLVGLAGWGIAQWDVPMLSRGVPDSGIEAALFGAASVFMAYEGFQLLAYDYEDIETAQKTLPWAVLSAIVVVIAVYVAVALGTAMLVGADQVVQHEEVALAIAGRQAFGTTGLVVVTIAAAFSTGSAINSTLFATARLTHDVTKKGELPAALDHENRAGVPDRAVIALGGLAAVLAALGTLGTLVEAASLAFLFTFAVVCGLALHQAAGNRLVTGLGAVGASAAAIALVFRLVRTDPVALVVLGALVVVAVVGRPLLLRYVRTASPSRRN
jgi:amino acid transporter